MGNNTSFHQARLKNGMSVVTYNIKDIMSLHFLLFINVGSVYEKTNNNGISHLVEHSAFLGTKKFSTAFDLAKETERIGAKRNGITGSNNTRYWISLPKEKSREGINFLKELVFNPLFRSNDIAKEKRVILSEYNNFWHNSERRFYYDSWKIRFKNKNNPYTQLPLGTPKSIKMLTVDDVSRWKNKYYTSENMFLVVVGNFDKKMLLKDLKKAFANVPQGKKQQEPKMRSIHYSNFEVDLQKTESPQIKFVLSFPTFGIKEKSRQERLALTILLRIIGNGPLSRLHQRIREKDRLVYSIYAGKNYRSWAGDLAISGATHIDTLYKTVKNIKEEIDNLKNKGVTKEEVRFATQYMNYSTKMAFDEPSSICYFFGNQKLNEKSIWSADEYIEASAKITTNDINKLIKKIFTYKKLNISLQGNISNKIREEIKSLFN
jgi:predicted Zn-dependent peptidase